MLKKILTYSLYIIGGFVSSQYLVSCAPPVCAEVSCLNGGVCRDGFCQCKDGWAGAECTVKPNETFQGFYQGVVKPGEGIAYNDTIIVLADTTTIDSFFIRFDFDGDPILVKAQAKENNTFVIEGQRVNNFPPSFIEGRGMLETDKLTLYFAYDKYQDSVLNCSFFGKRNVEGG